MNSKIDDIENFDPNEINLEHSQQSSSTKEVTEPELKPIQIDVAEQELKPVKTEVAEHE